MPDSHFLHALEGKNTTIPVWFMRQAGRYLPEYRKLREKYSLEEMFNTPEVAAEVTCQPIKRFDVDAAILFADILTLPAAMGCDIRFDNQKGPQVAKIDFTKIHDIKRIEHVEETIKLVNERLPKHIPLLGFAGSPFTVLTYLIEGGSSTHFKETFRFILNEPNKYQQLMQQLTTNTIIYLNGQRQAGIKAYQLFDTWIGILTADQFKQWVLPYLKQIFAAIKLPSIYYFRQAPHLLPLADQTGADFLSVCHTIALGDDWTLSQTNKGMQGNLHNMLLYADTKTIEKELKTLLKGATKHQKYIFNLSHGIFPDIDPDKIKLITDTVHQFKR